MNVVIVGRGRVGTGLAQGMREASIKCQLVHGQQPPEDVIAKADTVILAVPDAAIRKCAQHIAGWPQAHTSVLHCAGARGADELEPCRRAGAHVGVMHPLVSFADANQPPALRGTTFVAAGDARAIEAIQHLADAVGAHTLVAPIHGPAYHALAALVANGTVGLANAAVPMLQQLGIARREAEQAVAGLLKTVAENIEHLGVPKALTGPMARGDAAAVSAHRAALMQTATGVASAYDAIAPLVLRCAIDQGLPAARAEQIREALKRGPPGSVT
ncbi:MAG: DUF2520 domain-containing protein [Acidiferrobacterales bacterium]